MWGPEVERNQFMQTQHVTLESEASNAPSSPMPLATESSQLHVPTRVDLTGQDRSSRRITSSLLPEPAATDHDSLTAAWAAEVRMGNIALAAHLSPSRPTDEPAASPTGAETEAVDKDISAKSSTVNAFVRLWRERHGDFCLAIAVVLVAIVIPWAIWSK